jgi:hypothetical protein
VIEKMSFSCQIEDEGNGGGLLTACTLLGDHCEAPETRFSEDCNAIPDLGSLRDGGSEPSALGRVVGYT